MNAGRGVGEGPPDDDGGIVLAVVPGLRPRGRVQQDRAPQAVSHKVAPRAPIEDHAALRPGVAGKLLTIFRPIPAGVILLDPEGILLSADQIRDIEGEDAVGAGGGDGVDKRQRQPIQRILVFGADFVDAGGGGVRPHEIERVAILHIAAGTDDTVTRRGPRVGVIQSEVMAEFVQHHAQRVSLQVHALASYRAGRQVVEIGWSQGLVIYDLQIVVGGDKARVEGGRACCHGQGIVALDLVIVLGLRQDEQGSHLRGNGQGVIRLFRKNLVDLVHQTVSAGLGNGRGRCIRKGHRHEQQGLGALGNCRATGTKGKHQHQN